MLTVLPNVGRGLIGFYYVFFGLWNIYHWRPFMTIMVEKRIPLPFLILPLGIFWQIAAGSMILFNSYVRLAALALMVFIVIGCGIFHDFWNMKGETRKMHMTFFLTNFTLGLGTLIVLLNSITPLSAISDLTL